jgi:hypothetical protein
VKAFLCVLRTNPDQMGIAVSENFIPTAQDENGKIKYESKIGVCWLNQPDAPAPCYHAPNEISFASIYEPEFLEDDEEEDEADDTVAEVIAN